jgi:hypothetical protein
MEQKEKKFWEQKSFIYVAGFGLGLIIFLGMSNSSAPAPAKPDFSQQSRARFDSILAVSPELAGISCESNDCSYVAYFDFKTLPEDLDFTVRGNAATFSKFKLDNEGVSNVTVVARLNGNVLMSCEAAQGRVKECK